MSEVKQHRSIIGKAVADDAPPTHTMFNSVPVPLTPEQAALGFDKPEEEKAVCEIRNISKKEMKQRRKISNVGLLLSTLGVAIFVYKDNEIPRYFRLSMSGPFGIWFGYWLSAKAGI